MPTVTRKINEVEQQSQDYDHEKAEEEMKKRWDQLKHRKQAGQSDK
jgi:hypothetical protein